MTSLQGSSVDIVAQLDAMQTKKSGAALSKMESAAAAAQRKLQAQVEAAEGPTSVPAAGGPRGTLIVCPLSVLSN